ncbi:MAG TPA: hypothetical protein VLC98_06320 [Phnomibacter sp.]|nr:hypothetical protein [Phnomibacter sp.]
MSVALLVLFNHNYESNIEKLDKLYVGRFSNVFYIMPFYSGTRKDVIAVYENSYYFQGYISHALSRLDNYEYYLVIGDDVMLHPEINENNIEFFFGVNEQTAFIPGLFLLHDKNENRPSRPFAPNWIHTKSAFNFKTVQEGNESFKLMPSYDEAIKKLERHGLKFEKGLSYASHRCIPVLSRQYSYRENIERIKLTIKSLQYLLRPVQMQYPMIGSYSDIFLIPQRYKEKFQLYCGIFASMHLFVEIALPTALAFAAEYIVQEIDLPTTGLTLWNSQSVKELEDKYGRSLQNIKMSFPENTLYIHPIKFSRWT